MRARGDRERGSRGSDDDLGAGVLHAPVVGRPVAREGLGVLVDLRRARGGEAAHGVGPGVVEGRVDRIPAVDRVLLPIRQTPHGHRALEEPWRRASADVGLPVGGVHLEAQWQALALVQEPLDGPAEAVLLVDAGVTGVVRGGAVAPHTRVVGEALHRAVVCVRVCVGEVRDVVIVVPLLVREVVVGEDADDRLDVRVVAVGDVRVHGVVAARQHDHPHDCVARHELPLDPPAVCVRLGRRLVLVVEALALQLQVLQRGVDVRLQDLLVVPAAGHRVVAHLLLRDPRSLHHGRSLYGP
mmetsp:Transcript_38461/g.120058  ORF Transcript_38461/g.120058 Transcript_38461/m.120058 type:complete len:298 (+) Transcript_38461:29-922(+)